MIVHPLNSGILTLGSAVSLFADNRYQWRETYFVLFDAHDRPAAADVKAAIGELGARLEVLELQADDRGALESMTILSHGDSAGMDISYVSGEEVKEQTAELKKEWRGQNFTPDERAKADRALRANARYDIFHFEEMGDAFLDEDEDDAALDPGTLLLVLGKLCKLCHGISIDPQSGTLL